MEINKTVYGEIKTRKSLFPESKAETVERENLVKKGNQKPNENQILESGPSNKLSKLKERQKSKENEGNNLNEVYNEGFLHKPPITPIMQDHPIQKGIINSKYYKIEIKIEYNQKITNVTKMKPPTTTSFATHISLYSEKNVNYEKKNPIDELIDYSTLEEEKNRIYGILEEEKEQRKNSLLNYLSIKKYIGADSKWILKEFV